VDHKEKLHQFFARKPIISTLSVFVPIMAAYFALMVFLIHPSWHDDGINWIAVVIMISARLMITILCCYFIGIILRQSGFKFAFRTRGFFRGSLPCPR